jgi:hypothetical protein
MSTLMQARYIYGLGEGRTGRGNGLADSADWTRQTFPDVDVVINEYGDDVARELRESAQRGIRLFFLAGHSFGGAAIIRAAKELEQELSIQVAVLVDPVTNLLWGQTKASAWHVQDNILDAMCFYQRQSVFPVCSSMIRNLGPGRTNTLVDGLSRYEHCTICKDERVHLHISSQITKMHQRAIDG